MRQTVWVSIEVVVDVDEAKFTPEFLDEYRKSFYAFETVEEHIEHLAQMSARGIIGEPDKYSSEFIEGYGESSGFGIAIRLGDVDTEIQ